MTSHPEHTVENVISVKCEKTLTSTVTFKKKNNTPKYLQKEDVGVFNH